MTVDELRSALASVKYPGFSRDIVSFGLVQGVAVDDGVLTLSLRLQTRDPKIPEQIFKDCHAALDAIAGGPENVKIDIDIQDPPGAANTPGGVAGKQSIQGVKKIIATCYYDAHKSLPKRNNNDPNKEIQLLCPHTCCPAYDTSRNRCKHQQSSWE